MAERNVVYTRNRRSLNIPQVDYANSKAIAAGNSMLNQSINRLTAFMESQAEITARIEGAEYGAAHTPTYEQIQTSLLTGEDLELPGNKKGSVFERAARNATMEILSDQLTFKARSAIVDASIEAGESNFSPVQLREKFDAIMSGYAATLDVEEPKFAKRFRAQIGIFSNAEYKSYTSKYLKKVEIKNKSHFEASFQISLENVIPKLVEGGISTVVAKNLEDGTLPTKAILQGEKIALAIQMQKINYTRAEIKSTLDRFDAAVITSAKDIVTGYIMEAKTSSGAAELYSNLIYGNNLPDTVNAALELLPFTDEDTLRKLALESVNDFIAFGEQRNKIIDNNILDLEKEFDRRVNIALNRQKSNFAAGTKELQSILEDPNFAGLLPEKVAEHSMFMGDDVLIPNVSNGDLIYGFELDLSSRDPKKTVADVNTAWQNGQLTRTDFTNLSSKYLNQFNTDIKAVLDDAKNQLQLPEGYVLNKSSEQNERENAFSKLENALNRASRASPTDFDPYVWLSENGEKFILSAEAKIIEKHNTVLNRYGLTKKQLEMIVNTNEKVGLVIPATAQHVLETALKEGVTLPSNWND